MSSLRGSSAPTLPGFLPPCLQVSTPALFRYVWPFVTTKLKRRVKYSTLQKPETCKQHCSYHDAVSLFFSRAKLTLVKNSWLFEFTTRGINNQSDESGWIYRKELGGFMKLLWKRCTDAKFRWFRKDSSFHYLFNLHFHKDWVFWLKPEINNSAIATCLVVAIDVTLKSLQS